MDYSESLKDIIRLSREEAIRLGQDYIGVEHFALAIIRNDTNLALKLLKKLGLNTNDFKKRLEESMKREMDEIEGNLPLTKVAEKILKIVQIEQKIYKSDIVGSEHLLLSILRDESTVTTNILASYGITYNSVREAYSRYTNSKEVDVQLNKIIEFKPDEFAIDIFVDPGDATKDEILELYNALSDLHRAFGGIGIEFKEAASKILAGEEVEV